MTDIEKEALALVNEMAIEECEEVNLAPHKTLCAALRLSVLEHEDTKQEFDDFRQEVSDAVELSIDRSGHDGLRAGHINEYLGRFIIAKTDPLVEVLNEISHEGGFDNFNHYAHRLRAALEAHGLEIREKNDDK